MVTALTIRRALIASAALGVLAACNGGSTGTTNASLGQTPGAGAASIQRHVASSGFAGTSLLPSTSPRIVDRPVATRSFMNVDASKSPLVFVSDASGDVVDIYPQAGKNQKMVGQIAGLKQPQGLSTDMSGNLFVANTNASNVLVYAPPYTKATATLDDAGEFPADVAVSPIGVVAVTNICGAPNCRPGTASVSFYAKGSAKACATVSDEVNFPRITFAAFAKNGDLYVDGTVHAIITAFGVISGGCHAATITNIQPTYTVGFPGGLQVDSAGRIAVTDGVRFQVATFDPPVGGQFGSPVALTALTGSKAAVSSALVASATDLFVADSDTGLSTEYAYGTGGKVLDSIRVGGQPIGIAVTPPEIP